MTLTPTPADVPPGYPRQYERRVRLRDGRAVVVRPLIPADAPQLATLDYVRRFRVGRR